MEKVFIICNQEFENERFDNMQKQLANANIQNVEYFCKYWKTEIPDNYKYDNCNFENLNKGEISVFINHIEILKNIKNNYKDGNFLILESDGYVFPGMEFTNEKINKLLEFNLEWDIINIGGSCYQLFLEHGYPKTKEIVFDNTRFFKEDRLICIEALLWNYKSIVKFLDLYENFKKQFNYKIHLPIDVLLDYFINSNKLGVYWIHPCLIKQGSGSVWKSNIR